MASRVANPYGAATPLGEGLSSVFNAFLSAPTPEDRAKSALALHGMQADAKRALAAAGYDDTRTEQLRNELSANKSLADLFAMPEYDPIKANSVAVGGGLDPVKANQMLLNRQALTPGVTLPQMDPLVYAKGGNAGQTTWGVRLGDDTTRRGQDVTAATSRSNNAADNARVLAERRMIEAGLNNRFTTETSPGAITTLAPGNPLGVTRVEGLPTTDTQKGQILAEERAKPGFDPNAPQPANTPVGAALDIPSANQSNLRQVPTTTLNAAAEYQQTIRQIDRAQQLLKKGVDLGMPLNFNILNAVPGADQLSQWFNPQEVAELRMLITDIAGKRVHERYGAALTGTENTRASAYIPNLTDQMGPLATKLSNYRTQLADGLGIASSMFNDATGYDGRALMVSVPTAPTDTAPADTGNRVGQQVTTTAPAQDAAQLRSEAQSAIARGADERAVRARYYQMTGQAF